MPSSLALILNDRFIFSALSFSRLRKKRVLRPIPLGILPKSQRPHSKAKLSKRIFSPTYDEGLPIEYHPMSKECHFHSKICSEILLFLYGKSHQHPHRCRHPFLSSPEHQNTVIQHLSY